MSTHIARYDPTNGSRLRTDSLAQACLKTAGAAPGSIIAATINTHRLMNDTKEPGPVTPVVSIPFICWSAMTHAIAPSPTVASAASARMAASRSRSS